MASGGSIGAATRPSRSQRTAPTGASTAGKSGLWTSLDLSGSPCRCQTPVYRGSGLMLPVKRSRTIRLPLPPQTASGDSQAAFSTAAGRVGEHTPELQSRPYSVCRLLLDKKNSYEVLI